MPTITSTLLLAWCAAAARGRESARRRQKRGGRRRVVRASDDGAKRCGRVRQRRPVPPDAARRAGVVTNPMTFLLTRRPTADAAGRLDHRHCTQRIESATPRRPPLGPRSPRGDHHVVFAPFPAGAEADRAADRRRLGGGETHQPGDRRAPAHGSRHGEAPSRAAGRFEDDPLFMRRARNHYRRFTRHLRPSGPVRDHRHYQGIWAALGTSWYIVNRPGFDGGSVQATAVLSVPGLVRRWTSSNSMGDILPIEWWMRLVLYQWTQLAVSRSSSAAPLQLRVRSWSTSSVL